MKQYAEIIGTQKLNEYVKLGWDMTLAYAKPVVWSDDGNTVTEVRPAFVVAWNKDSEPVKPQKPQIPEPIPVPVA